MCGILFWEQSSKCYTVVCVVSWSKSNHLNVKLTTSETCRTGWISCFSLEPPLDKTSKMIVRPAKTQNNLGIRPVWSESWLCAQWVAKDPGFLHADSDDSDQTVRMPRLIWVFAGCTCHIVGFVMSRLIWAMSWENLLYAICEQQRCRSACTSVQSNQCPFLSLTR